MDFLKRAYDEGIEESITCEKVEQLIRCGADVNTGSRNGGTMLHFAAKKALPKLVGTLLTANI
jgi:ankyrin repeat protein